MAIDPKSSYYDEGGIEVFAIIKAKLTLEQWKGFLLGNILKYGARANFKGSFDRDIEKVGVYQGLLDEETDEEPEPLAMGHKSRESSR